MSALPIPQAAFTLKGRNPDVLTCIANLSNDEVFTPPEFACRMLDTLAAAWAANRSGTDNPIEFVTVQTCRTKIATENTVLPCRRRLYGPDGRRVVRPRTRKLPRRGFSATRA